jgi:hypothetical protein
MLKNEYFALTTKISGERAERLRENNHVRQDFSFPWKVTPGEDQ